MTFKSIDEVLKKLEEVHNNINLYIWGIGLYGKLWGQVLNKKGIRWKGYYDNFNKIYNNYLNDKPVYDGNKINTFENAVYILSMRNYASVRKQLMELKVQEENIIYFDEANIFNSIADYIDEFQVAKDKIKYLYNIHSGNSCFIIGNGPSLIIDDLNKICNKEIVSFACNLIFKCYGGTKWRPYYYFFVDENGIRTTFGKDGVLKYVSDNCKFFFCKHNSELSKYACEINNLVPFKSAVSNSLEQFDFSEDCSEKIYGGFSVTYMMLQMAIYMGFKKIYLLGIDHSSSMEVNEVDMVLHHENINNHSEILGNYPLWGVSDLRKTTAAYEKAKKYADSHGIKIYNATRGGKLEVFERVCFDELFD